MKKKKQSQGRITCHGVQRQRGWYFGRGQVLGENQGTWWDRPLELREFAFVLELEGGIVVLLISELWLSPVSWGIRDKWSVHFSGRRMRV